MIAVRRRGHVIEPRMTHRRTFMSNVIRIPAPILLTIHDILSHIQKDISSIVTKCWSNMAECWSNMAECWSNMAECWLNADSLLLSSNHFCQFFQISVYGVKSIQQELQIFCSKLKKFKYLYLPEVVGLRWVTKFKVSTAWIVTVGSG